MATKYLLYWHFDPWGWDSYAVSKCWSSVTLWQDSNPRRWETTNALLQKPKKTWEGSCCFCKILGGWVVENHYIVVCCNTVAVRIVRCFSGKRAVVIWVELKPVWLSLLLLKCTMHTVTAYSTCCSVSLYCTNWVLCHCGLGAVGAIMYVCIACGATLL